MSSIKEIPLRSVLDVPENVEKLRTIIAWLETVPYSKREEVLQTIREQKEHDISVLKSVNWADLI